MPCLRAKSALYRSTFTFVLATTLIAGCGSNEDASKTSADNSQAESDTATSTTQSGASENTSDSAPRRREFKPLTLGGTSTQSTSTAAAADTEQQTQSIIDALKPLQIMLGTWRGTTRKVYDGFKAVDEHSWVFDFRTNRNQPALVMESDKSPYFRKVRLTYLPSRDIYQLTGTDADGTERTLEGQFTEAVANEPGDDGKLQRTYKLELTEPESSNDERWQLVFNQQENNRYLQQLSRARGNSSFRLYDTVSTQREGTSFALSDTDYGEKECIVSQGLGTIAVRHEGKTYWVCCTGCKAAFEDDPEHWVAKLEKRMAEQNQ